MKRRDRDAEFSEFVAAHQRQLRRFAYSVCGDWTQAEDLLQTALTKLYVAWPKMRSRGVEHSYARRIILRATIDEKRRPWRRESPGLEGFDHPAAPGADIHERDELITALAQIPKRQREVVVLRHLVGLSVEQTAEELGLAPGTVKAHAHRALPRLRELLGESLSERN
ncbi:SigE family RNA polymerase sigma factor [Nocardioides speluncae]|uniref:SigE family RNA polymerase sigma factor n=1 Tax=Nocardioides speluncae TaxID=2670337 RepID=UPI000D690921|nr:SigE family RNA polymerase sigma factor [Nocardioides speluncae]